MEEQPESELGTSKEKPIEIEDEESSDENSVIILDSDTEKEDDGGEDGENGDDEDEDLVEDEEESEASDEESEEDDEDTDSSVDSDSVNSVWSEIGEAAEDEITVEAAEAKIVKKFERAMISIADNDVDKGRKILETILDDPIISCFTHEDLDFEALEEPPRLAKMLQIFIATHKNLAKLCEKSMESMENQDNNDLQNQEIQHLCQVLAYEPNNSEIWLDVALKSVESGDLNFAKYAFKRCENMKESMESHATLLYLTCDYSDSLMVLKQFKEQNDVLSDKMKYLKHKIRDTNQYYKRLCDRIFEEDEVYADIDFVEKRKILAFDERIEELKKKIQGKNEKRDKSFKEEKELMSTIPIQISAEQDLPTVCTLFCDLFDRIHNFSHCRKQLIEITEWESRNDYLQVVETVNSLVDIVECVEELTEKVDESQKKKKGKRERQQEKKDYLANWRRRLFVEKTVEEVITLDSEANTTADEDDETSQDEERMIGDMPDNELAQEFDLVYTDVESIMTGDKKRAKTPPPSQQSEFISSGDILHLLEIQFSGGTHTILEILENTLLLLSDHSPNLGAFPENMKEVTREMYYRLALYSEIKLNKFHKLNVLLMELDVRKAMELCILKYISPFWKEQKEDENDKSEEENKEENRSFMIRFMWKYTQTGLADETKLDYLNALRSLLEPEESIRTSFGSFATWDVDIAIEELEKKKRIDSVKHLWKSKNFESLVGILQNDIDFSSIGIEEAMELINYWVQSLERMKSSGDLLNMLSRAIHFYLFTVENVSGNTVKEETIEKNLSFLLPKVYRIVIRDTATVSKRRLPTLSTIGYFVCVIFRKYPKFEKDWKNWRILFEIVRIQRGDANKYVKSLDKTEHPSAMPLLELDLLVKAHEVLGEHQCCAQKNYEFLMFYVDQMRKLIDNVQFLEICYLKDGGFLWDNLNVELSQVLFCLFGKYSRKVRAQENHENGGRIEATPEIYKKIMGVILVHPLPLHDEKEKLTHDVVDLLNSKFPSFIKVSAEKEEMRKKFVSLLEQAKSVEDVNKILRKCQDDYEDDTQSLVWYALALKEYRQNNFEEAKKYSELYLLTDDRVQYERQRNSAWGMMAHASGCDITIHLDLAEVYEQWKWRIMPHRMAVHSHQNEPGPHFELAVLQYQLATTLTRFQRNLPSTDPRRQDVTDIKKLREEARQHFGRTLELTKVGDDGSQPDHYWLCYFFIAKLEAKNEQSDILKVVESFFEAACGCELLGYYYPQKVQTKKQQNFEPLEVHYQAFSAVYKYLTKNQTPDLETLRKLRVLLKLMTDGHKVVKPNSSLFKVNIDVYTIVDELVMGTVFNENILNEDLRHELVSDLKEMCKSAFELITDRFPHIKSYYRLAQLYLENDEIDKASDQIYKNVFKRKKRDDGMFDNLIEIQSSDIYRKGSSHFHVRRCIEIGAEIVLKTKDLHNAVAMLTTMIGLMLKKNDENVEKATWKRIVIIYLTAVEKISKSRENTSTRSTPSPAPDDVPKPVKLHHVTQKILRTELWRLWQSLSKTSKSTETLAAETNELVKLMKAKTLELINHHFKSVEELRARMQPYNANDPLKKNKANGVKRKLDDQSIAGSKNLNDIAMRLVQNQMAGSQSNALNQLAQVIMKNNSGNPTLSSFAAILAQAANTAAKAQVTPTSSPAKAPAPQPTSSTVSAAAKQLTAPSTSTSVSAGPIRPIPRYSPISSDDEIQCLDPPPAKKPTPAPAPPSTSSAASSVASATTSSTTTASQRNTGGAEPPKQMVPSVFGGVKAAVPGQPSVPKVATNPIKPVAQKVQQKPPVPPAPKPQNPVPKPVEKPTALNPSITLLPNFRAQFDAIVKMNSSEDIRNLIIKNIDSTDPSAKQIVQQAQLYLLEKQLKSTAPKTKTTQPPTSSPAKQFTPADIMAALAQFQIQAAAKNVHAVQAEKERKEKADQLVRERLARIDKEQKEKAAKEKAAKEKAAKEKAAKEKAAREEHAARIAKTLAAAEAKKTQDAQAAAQLLQVQQLEANKKAFMEMAQKIQAAQKNNKDLAQQQQISQQLAAAWTMMNAAGMQMPSTSSAPNLKSMDQMKAAQNLALTQQKLQAAKATKPTVAKPQVPAQKATSSSSAAPTRPIVVNPQVVRPHPYKPPQATQRVPTQPIRQSASTSSLPATNRPTTTQNSITLPREQLEQMRRLDRDSLIRVLNAVPDAAQRQSLLNQLMGKK
ncbi:hypothetical protein CAEBREN_16860 [Caenorhabditis brenneri]|uniref:Uncharacterized protein n=1 Tax=Caenorhabditis brenneri TaxID=135651 RepID=G0NBK3_CAEBE|nr:hypothetical protein CAEBREN_16860 [Caenorhabditis brenneri]